MLCTVRESPPTGAQGTRTWSPLRGGAGHLTSPVHTRESIGSLGPPHLSIICITPVYLPSRLSVRTWSPQGCPWLTTAPRCALARASLAAMGAQTTGCAATATIPAGMLALPSHPVGEFAGPGDSDLTRPRALASRTHELLATVWRIATTARQVSAWVISTSHCDPTAAPSHRARGPAGPAQGRRRGRRRPRHDRRNRRSSPSRWLASKRTAVTLLRER